MKVGDIEITPVHDGMLVARPPTACTQHGGSRLAAAQAIPQRRGEAARELGGFLLRVGDAAGARRHGGRGQCATPAFGRLPAQPGGGGRATRAEITDVVLTHLHFDHMGWAERRGAGRVPQRHVPVRRARTGASSSAPTATTRAPPCRCSAGCRQPSGCRPWTSRLETWSSDISLAPGVDVRAAPGHTPGSTIVVVSSGTERAMLLGDVVHCPVELLEDEWEMIADIDKDLARRTREALAREIRRDRHAGGGRPFPRHAVRPAAAGRRANGSWVFD